MATVALLVLGLCLLCTVRAQDWNFPEEAPDNGENSPGERPIRRPEPQQQQQQPQQPIRRPEPQQQPQLQQPQLQQQQQQQQSTNRPTTSAQSTPSSLDLDPANPGTVIFLSPCSGCQVTQQYNPVCGSDNRTYANKLVLDCHRFCGYDVSLRRMGGCSANRS